MRISDWSSDVCSSDLRLIRSRTQLGNAIRGYAAEFGLTAAKGICKVEPLLERIAADVTLPELARDLFALHARDYEQLQRSEERRVGKECVSTGRSRWSPSH